MPDTRKPLGIKEVEALLEKSPDTKDAILVGGQALNVLAVHYGLASVATALSDDIDFFGDAHKAIAAGKAWDGKTKTATLDDHTPNSAFVLINIGGTPHQIDFMAQIQGVQIKELHDWAAIIEADGASFRVMHPVHVLQSQIENVYGVLNRRSWGQRMVQRVVLSVQVADSAIRERLEKGAVRDALKIAERIAEIAVTPSGLRAWREDEVDVLSAIPEHPRWPSTFTTRRLPQIRKYVTQKREKLLK